jgi:hypothetical protein
VPVVVSAHAFKQESWIRAHDDSGSSSFLVQSEKVEAGIRLCLGLTNEADDALKLAEWKSLIQSGTVGRNCS